MTILGVTSKHLATFILGAAAGIALQKYLDTEQGEKVMEDLKAKGNELKDEAEAAIEKAPEYFKEPKIGLSIQFNKVVENFKNQYPEAKKKMISDLFFGLIKPGNLVKNNPEA
jgi:hypothetical protein